MDSIEIITSYGSLPLPSTAIPAEDRTIIAHSPAVDTAVDMNPVEVFIEVWRIRLLLHPRISAIISMDDHAQLTHSPAEIPVDKMHVIEVQQRSAL